MIVHIYKIQEIQCTDIGKSIYSTECTPYTFCFFFKLFQIDGLYWFKNFNFSRRLRGFYVLNFNFEEYIRTRGEPRIERKVTESTMATTKSSKKVTDVISSTT